MSERPVRLTRQDIDDAFRADQLVVFYQPQIDLDDGSIKGLEAFIRWRHPAFGLMAPNLFLNFMESQGRMGEVTSFVLDQALDALDALVAKGLDWPVSINVPVSPLLDARFISDLKAKIQAHNLGSGRIALDVPEGALSARYMSDWPQIAPALSHLRQFGVNLALDGPGPRPFELRQIRPFTFNQVKLGGQSIINFARSTLFTRRGLIPSRVRFCEDHDVIITAVGVENEETLVALQELGFNRAQGRFMASPMPLSELFTWYDADYPAFLTANDLLFPALRDEGEETYEEGFEEDEFEVDPTAKKKGINPFSGLKSVFGKGRKDDKADRIDPLV